ncbi:hypothetical protein E5A73_02560 [Sphingomonas gei]|uniref:Uncharacterized protein n=1 Tax=Sphingomonas gei TaxID=1395960 RepID=A0A4S1XH99_9SPHN|nr:hypothetical protein [Sphingomonas gei]TGX56014.1 hypothetical protein E5A73_02560 [Sphingomonas gei]
MTRGEFVEKATMLGIDPTAYDLDGRPSESYVLANEGAEYKVFYSERGLETGKELFPDESAALQRLLDLLVQDSSALIR